MVVRRGLAKSNRHRFATITDFSDALRAAAAGRLRETQWAATLAYAAGEVASHDSKGRSGRRLRRLLLTLAAAASVALGFVVGGKWNRGSSFLRAPSPAGAPGGITAIVDRLDAQAESSRDAQEAESSAAREDAPEAREEIVVVPAHPAPHRREMRPRHVRRPAVRTGPRLPASVDGDATLPASEPSN
jgi:hypothetical protein